MDCLPIKQGIAGHMWTMRQTHIGTQTDKSWFGSTNIDWLDVDDNRRHSE